MKKAARIQLLDRKRSRNVLIALSSIRAPVKDIVTAISRMEWDCVSVEVLERILTIFPSDEELELVTSYGGNVEVLAKPEKFFLLLSQDPKINSKIRWMLFHSELGAVSDALEGSLNELINALNTLLTSNELRRFLLTVLQVGNYMNSDTSNANAYGFKMQSLLSLRMIKSSDRRSNLLLFVASFMEHQGGSMRELAKDLQCVVAGSRVEYAHICNEINRFRQALSSMRAYQFRLEEKKNDDERVIRRLGDVIAEASPRLRQIEALRAQVQDRWRSIREKFPMDDVGEDLKAGDLAVWVELSKHVQLLASGSKITS
uniref:FH2 domain-containing protein n=1 Tax=Lotharella oceanica TaxID=641309 RepID=A0A7S2TRA2_9EUKA